MFMHKKITEYRILLQMKQLISARAHVAYLGDVRSIFANQDETQKINPDEFS